MRQSEPLIKYCDKWYLTMLNTQGVLTASYRRMPVGLFSMAVGVLAWSQLWRLASEYWQFAAIWAEWLTAAAVVVWLGLMLRLLQQVWQQPRDEWLQWFEPRQAPQLALVFVSSFLVVSCIEPWSHNLAELLFWSALPLQLALGLWWLGGVWQGRRDATTLTATSYLPTVAQNLVGATAAVQIGQYELATLLFGAGVFSWLSFESVILQRAAFGPALSLVQRPQQGVQIAPAVVAGLGYLALKPGEVDLLASMLLGYGLYQLLLAVRLSHWTWQSERAPSYWSFSFGVVAAASMALQFQQRTTPYSQSDIDSPWAALALGLFVLANVVIGALLGLTLLLWRRGLLTQQVCINPN